MNYEEVLKFIEDNYLNSFDFEEIDSEIKLNSPITETTFVKETYLCNSSRG